MNQSVLVGFGDSWAAGHDLDTDEKSYIELAAQQLRMHFYNFAVGSSSVPHLILQFQKFIDTVYFPGNQYHAVFFLTAQERNFCFDQDTKDIVHLSPGSNPTHEYYKFYNNEFGNFVFNSTILSLQRLCDIYDIKDYYMLGWQQNKLWSTVDLEKFWKQGKKTATELFHDQEEFVLLHDLIGLNGKHKNVHFGPDHNHPNQLGHKKIAQALDEWIESD
jgi:hypothetical protein